MGEQARFTAAEKAEVLGLVARTRVRTGWTLRRILKRLGLSRGRYHEWVKRAQAETLDDLVRPPKCPWQVLPEEVDAVIGYALSHPHEGYRRLAWMMVDEDVAYLSPSSVYRILDDADLLYRWKRSQSVGERPPDPTRPNERWHTDLMYLRVGDVWYFLVTVLDAYSRYVVQWDLLTSMTAADVRVVIQDALKLTGATPEVVTDNGSQFTAKDFKELVRDFALEHIRIRTYHPESQGRIERFHRSTREALDGANLENLSKAREIIGRWVTHYNERRLHAALQYLPPAEYYAGNPTARLAERKQKLAAARTRRRELSGTHGNNVLAAVYAGNVAAAIVAALEHPAVGGPFNITNDGAMTQREFFIAVAEAMGRRVHPVHIPLVAAATLAVSYYQIRRVIRPRRYPGVPASAARFLATENPYTSERTQRQLGWRPMTPPTEAVARAVRSLVNER